MPFQIRRWLPSDTPGVIDVIHTVYYEYGFTWDESGYHADLYDIATHYEGQGHLFFVAEEEGKVLGTAILERFSNEVPGEPATLVHHEGRVRIGGTDCSLERLYVHPDARKMGVGSALINQVVQEAKQDDRNQLEIWSDKRFEAAHRLYGRFGAEVVGDRICHDPDQSPEWGLAIRL